MRFTYFHKTAVREPLCSSEQGIAMVEFALGLVVFLSLLVGSIDVALSMSSKSQSNHLTSKAARELSIDSQTLRTLSGLSCYDAGNGAASLLRAGRLSGKDVRVKFIRDLSGRGWLVQVSASHERSSVLGHLVPGLSTVASTVRIPIEDVDFGCFSPA